MSSLVEIDCLEVLVIVDNEVDPLSTYQIPDLNVSGGIVDIAARVPLSNDDRGEAETELRLSNVCCGAHGLSLMITAIKGDEKQTLMFDTGPEESAWERNVKRLRPDIASIELIHLSHWHTDHSGGMLRAVQMINEAKATSEPPGPPVRVDLHPDRPMFRGFMAAKPLSMEADPAWEEIESAGGKIEKNSEIHTVLDDMFLISGEIPRITPYETGLARGIRFNGSSWEKDEAIADERFVMCNLKGKGIVMFTGCSHAGVINATKECMRIAGDSVPLYAVMGGYHLVGPNEIRVKETVADFKKLDPKILLPGHCSGWRVRYEIEQQLPGRLAPSTVGTKFTL